MAHQRFRMVAWCRVPRKYLCLLADTFLGKPWRCRVSACWVTASPTADQFGQTTSRAPSFSLAGCTVHTWGILRHGIDVPVRQSCAHAGQEWDAFPQTMHNSHRALALQLSHH